MSDRQTLGDRYGMVIGFIQSEGTKQILRDRYGYWLGTYDSHDGFTRDRYGTVVARGNLLVTLLK